MTLSYWPSGFYEELKEHYTIHLNSPILWQSVTKYIIETRYIFIKSPKTTFDFLKFTQKSTLPRFNVVTTLKKICQALLARIEQANLQRTLNKGAGDASLTIFVTDSRYQISLYTILNFGTEFAQKQVFPVENRKSKYQHWTLHILIILQSVTKYLGIPLVFMWNSALRKDLIAIFLKLFC